MIYPVGPLAIPVWRMVHPKWQHAPFSGEGARLSGGRWNMKGWPALYLATDTVTAVAEFYRDLPKPGMMVPYRLDSRSIADLTDGSGEPADSQVEKAATCAWDKIAKQDREVPPSWTLAQELIAAGADGALVPSAQRRGGTNLVLWRWHDADGDGDGAALTLLDPERALLGR